MFSFRFFKYFFLLCLLIGCGSASTLTPSKDQILLPERSKAINFVCWYRGCYQELSTENALLTIRNVGANTIQIVPTWYQDHSNSSEIKEHQNRSPSVEEIRSVIQLAQKHHFRVFLKPHVDILDGSSRTEMNPSDRNQWKQNYENFLLTFATVAQETGVEVLSIGTELKTISNDTEFWKELIHKIRTRYHGFLTYSANWDEYQNIGFWDSLDFIGIDFYFPIANRSDADEQSMENALSSIKNNLESFSAIHQKSFLMTEVGYRSTDGTTIKPYDFNSNPTLDLQEQADAYQAFLTVFNQDEFWVEEIAWWSLDPLLQGGSTNSGYSPYGKPAFEVLRSFWK